MGEVTRYEVALDTRLALVPPTRPETVAPVVIWFDGRRFTWHPATAEYFAVLTVDVENPDDSLAAEEAVQRLLSALSFQTDVPIRSLGGDLVRRPESSPPMRYPRDVTIRFRSGYEIVMESDPKLRMCLALMREAMTSVSIAQKFLGYWKVIELVAGQKTLPTWVNKQRDRLRGLHGPEYRPDLGVNWYAHLYESRNAAAHAVPSKRGALQHDPDDSSLEHRLSSDIGIVSLLARYAIETSWPDAVLQRDFPGDALSKGAQWQPTSPPAHRPFMPGEEPDEDSHR